MRKHTFLFALLALAQGCLTEDGSNNNSPTESDIQQNEPPDTTEPVAPGPDPPPPDPDPDIPDPGEPTGVCTDEYHGQPIGDPPWNWILDTSLEGGYVGLVTVESIRSEQRAVNYKLKLQREGGETIRVRMPRGLQIRPTEGEQVWLDLDSNWVEPENLGFHGPTGRLTLRRGGENGELIYAGIQEDTMLGASGQHGLFRVEKGSSCGHHVGECWDWTNFILRVRVGDTEVSLLPGQETTVDIDGTPHRVIAFQSAGASDNGECYDGIPNEWHAIGMGPSRVEDTVVTRCSDLSELGGDDEVDDFVAENDGRLCDGFEDGDESAPDACYYGEELDVSCQQT